VLQNTFLHVPGIGKTTEKRLWKEGCTSWDHLLAEPDRWSLGSASRSIAKKHIEKSRQALQDEEHQFFRCCLGANQAWRAFPEFRHSCVYLDIETDGGVSANSVTMVGLYDGKQYRCLVKGEDLEAFRDLISHYAMVVTFFGGTFDLPVLLRRFPGLAFDQIHIDLCPILRQIGYRGGLKKIERQIGIERSPETQGLTGYDAVLLWRRHRMFGDSRALERLIAYNREDCVNLERLAEVAYEGMRDMVFETGNAELGTRSLESLPL
jgi:uncharacterized protein YprB with RNaseH-like and TPR domain